MNPILFWTILLFSFWMILTANFETANLVVGVGVSLAIAILYTKMFKSEKVAVINPYYLFIYFLILIKNIIISNIKISKRVISPDMKLNPAIVAIKTELTSDWKKLLLANSITLTPETLTLDIKEDILYIHLLECTDIANKEHVTKEFENIIAKI